MIGTNMVTDVRIIVEGLNDVKKVCEALELSSLGSDYNASITSIIPTTDCLIAVNAACGADIVLIATDADTSGNHLGDQIAEALEGVCAIVEKVRLPNGQNVEYYDRVLLKEAIEKTIVKSGLRALKYLRKEFEEIEAVTDTTSVPIKDSPSAKDGPLLEGEDRYEMLSFFEQEEEDSKEEDSKEEEEQIHELNQMRIDNQNYQAKIMEMERRINEFMIDSYERYDIKDVWESLYSDPLPEYQDISLAASRLSDEVFVSGNFIFAQTLKKVEDFLTEFRETFL